MIDAKWWCVSIVTDASLAYVDRQLKHWVDGRPVLWTEPTKRRRPDVYEAIGLVFYVQARNKAEAMRKVDEVQREPWMDGEKVGWEELFSEEM